MIDTTKHIVRFKNADDLSELEDNSVSLVLTSPPYPMIEMWDDSFSSQDPAIADALETNNPLDAFERMHQVLDKVWNECYRVLHQGGVGCINVVDVMSTINKKIKLLHNYS